METQPLTIAQLLHLTTEESAFLEQSKLSCRMKIEQHLVSQAQLSDQFVSGEEVSYEQV